MTPIPLIDIAIILTLIALNGVFALSELAIVSARTALLQVRAQEGSRGAQTAIDLAAEPGRFLSTVQIGITLIGIIAGAYSGASLGGPVAERIALFDVDKDTANNVGFAIVIGLTTYASLIIGELVPKQLALRSPEPIAINVALPMHWLSKVTAPIVWLLEKTSFLIFKLLRLSPVSKNQVTAEELHLIVAEASRSGVLEEHERAAISGIVRLADRPVREIMTPRTEVDWIDLNASESQIEGLLKSTQHSRLVVGDGSIDEIVGVVLIRDILAKRLGGTPIKLEDFLRPLEKTPDQVDTMDALLQLRNADFPMLQVHDEYGHFEGLVTPTDVLSGIAGEFQSERDEGDSPHLVRRDDGSYLVSGAMPIDQLAQQLDFSLSEDREYATVAGHMLELFRRFPIEGERVADQGWQFEIVDMDGRKIDKLIVRKMAEA